MGRDDVLRELDAVVDGLHTGGFRLALVTGAGGVGKSRVVAEVLERSRHGAHVLSARCYRWGRTTSFGPWLEALDRYLAHWDPQDVHGVCGTALGDLAAVLPAVGRTVEEVPASPPRHRLLDALATLLGRLARERAVLVAIDDLHLADASAWEALRFLGRRLGEAPLGVLATARPAELRSHPTPAEVLIGLDDDGRLTRVDLEPLSRPHVATLAHEVLRRDPRVPSAFVPDRLVTWLVDRSLGHPLFVLGLLRALADEGADLAAPRLRRLPETLRDRIALDLQSLGADEREILEILAVVGRRVAFDTLDTLAERGLADLAGVLESLTRRELVAEQGGRDDVRYEVAHPIVADAIYDGIGTARRRVLHGTVARTLLDADDLGAAAAHLALAGTRDDEAVDALFRAMERAGARDLHHEALAVLEALLEVLEPEDERWVRVLDSVTLRSEWVLSHLAESDAGTAVAAMRRVIAALAGSPDTAARAVAMFHLAAFQSFGQGELVAGEDTIRRAIELFRRVGDVEGELLATNELAWIRGCRGDLAAHARIAREVLDRGDGHIHVAVQAAGTAAYATGVMGRFTESRELTDRTLSAAHRAGNRYRVAWAQAQASVVLALEGSLDDAVAMAQAALEAHDAAPEALALEDLAHAHWLAGQLDEAADALERSAIRRPVVGSRRRAWGAALAARVHGELGDRGRARSHLDRAAATYDDHFLAWSAWSEWSGGWLAWLDGQPSQAVERLQTVAHRLSTIDAWAYEAVVLHDLVEVAADDGDEASVSSAVDRLRAVAAATDGRLAGWLEELAHARLAWLRGDPDEAVRGAGTASGALGDAGYRLLAADADELAGRALGAIDRPEAIARLRLAAEGFGACGAVWRRERVVATLAAMGSRGRRAAAAVQGPGALTDREREVAVLTARGHTASEVGKRLYIGKRTVETHLANIYAKLGVASKRELIRGAGELGLVDGPVPGSVPHTEARPRDRP